MTQKRAHTLDSDPEDSDTAYPQRRTNQQREQQQSQQRQRSASSSSLRATRSSSTQPSIQPHRSARSTAPGLRTAPERSRLAVPAVIDLTTPSPSRKPRVAQARLLSTLEQAIAPARLRRGRSESNVDAGDRADVQIDLESSVQSRGSWTSSTGAAGSRTYDLRSTGSRASSSGSQRRGGAGAELGNATDTRNLEQRSRPVLHSQESTASNPGSSRAPNPNTLPRRSIRRRALQNPNTDASRDPSPSTHVLGILSRPSGQVMSTGARSRAPQSFVGIPISALVNDDTEARELGSSASRRRVRATGLAAEPPLVIDISQPSPPTQSAPTFSSRSTLSNRPALGRFNPFGNSSPASSGMSSESSEQRLDRNTTRNLDVGSSRNLATNLQTSPSSLESDEALARWMQEQEVMQATRTADGYVDQYGHYQDLGWSSRSNLDAWRSAGFHEPSPDFPTELLDDAPRYGRLLNNPGNYMADDHVDTTYEGLWALSERIGSAKSKSTPLYMIDRLPVVKYQVGMLMGDDSRCTICLTEFEVGEMLKRLPCTHAYHGECINRWLRMHEQCPICRISVTDTLDPQKPEPLMPQ